MANLGKTTIMQKKILIIEDSDIERDKMALALKNRGFEVFTAKTVSEAREMAEEHWESSDVAMLDPNTTGADLGIEFRGKYERSPEPIIFSAYVEAAYYKLAMELGVTAYLDKGMDLFEFVRHIRAIALRKALNIEDPETLTETVRIITRSSDRKNAVELFCRHVFAPELKACLGTPFFLILTSDNQSQLFGSSIELPYADEILGTLQSLAQAESSNPEPFPLDLTRLASQTGIEMLKEFEVMEGSMLLPLFNYKEHKISLTLVLMKEAGIDLSRWKAGDDIVPPKKLIEDPLSLWKVLNQYLKPTVVEHLLTIFSEWTGLKAEVTLQSQKNTLHQFGQLCVSIGLEQAALLRKSDALEGVAITKLRAMADDLTQTGNLLRHIENPTEELVAHSSVSARSILSEVWENIRSAENLETGISFVVESDCAIDAEQNDLYVIFSRLLQWFTKRLISTPADVGPIIAASCTFDHEVSTIVLTDNSVRLSDTIRRELFVPFTQSIATPFNSLFGGNNQEVPGRYLPLYIAKMLIDLKYKGEFVDATQQLDGALGHKFILRFYRAGSPRENCSNLDLQTYNAD
jgi:DNA-binding NarL/FixJ family response regulator